MPTQFVNLAEGYDFSVRAISWQRGNYITNTWNTSMRCGFDDLDGMGCLGALTNGTRVAIYVH